MKALPNIISIFRICLVPVFLIVYFSEICNATLYAAIIFAVAAISDFVDGYLARKYSATSNLGKILDPLGDKLMTVAVMASITIDGIIPLWPVLVVVAKELLMAAGGVIVHRKARAEMPPSNIVGKSATVVFFLVCLALMLFREIPRGVGTAMIAIAIALTFLALISYIKTFVAVMSNKDKRQPGDAST